MSTLSDSEIQGLSETGIFLMEGISEQSEGFAQGPERALLSALLFDGIQAYINFCLVDEDARRDRFAEAYHWVHSADGDYIFSFENVCAGLGINPDYLRLGLINVCRCRRSDLRKIRKSST